jgi:hypothetical protein
VRRGSIWNTLPPVVLPIDATKVDGSRVTTFEAIFGNRPCGWCRKGHPGKPCPGRYSRKTEREP